MYLDSDDKGLQNKTVVGPDEVFWTVRRLPIADLFLRRPVYSNLFETIFIINPKEKRPEWIRKLYVDASIFISIYKKGFYKQLLCKQKTQRISGSQDTLYEIFRENFFESGLLEVPEKVKMSETQLLSGFL